MCNRVISKKETPIGIDLPSIELSLTNLLNCKATKIALLLLRLLIYNLFPKYTRRNFV